MDRVVICGGGPVGLIAALGLARGGVPVTVLESAGALQDDPRAATTHPATLELLDALGMEEDMRRVGLVARYFQFWDRVSGEKIAEFDHAMLSGDTRFDYVVQCEQFKTAKIALALLEKEPDAEVLFGHEVVDLAQHDDHVMVHARTHAGMVEHRASHVIGADGGRSLVRKAIKAEFTGFTFPEMFMVLTTPFDFEKHHGYCFRSYFADPDEWCNCFKVSADGPPGLWRLVFPVDTQTPEDVLLSDENTQAKLQKFFPNADGYELVHRNLYHAHQRVAETFRKGRVMLAGDAAHVNNPIGGMGLNGGIQDAANLSEKLTEVWHGRADDRLLDLYDLQRRTITTEFVQSQSIQNKKRLEAKDPETRAANFRELRETAADPVRAREFLLRTSMLDAQRRAAAKTAA